MKETHLQIRLSKTEKADIVRRARQAKMDMSAWALSQLLPPAEFQMQKLLRVLSTGASPKLVLAEIHDFLHHLPRQEFHRALQNLDTSKLSDFHQNYVAAMVEVAAQQKDLQPPTWVQNIPPLSTPVFGTDYPSLRLHLLTAALPPFRARNLFVDSSIGARV